MAYSPTQLLLVGVAFGAFVLAVITGRIWSGRQVRRWCKDQGYELLEWRGAKFYEGPSAWVTSENQNAYRIRVLDRNGLKRSGYLVMGSYWVPWSSEIRVKWD